MSSPTRAPGAPPSRSKIALFVIGAVVFFVTWSVVESLVELAASVILAAFVTAIVIVVLDRGRR